MKRGRNVALDNCVRLPARGMLTIIRANNPYIESGLARGIR